MKRILCPLLVATLPFGSVLADAPKSKNAKVTLVYHQMVLTLERPGLSESNQAPAESKCSLIRRFNP
jgi:hypothetical protein